MDPLLRDLISDLFVNLAAGWFGAAIIVPVFSRRPRLKWVSLTIDVILGIVFLTFAYGIRKFI
jgi:hypothetical protein